MNGEAVWHTNLAFLLFCEHQKRRQKGGEVFVIPERERPAGYLSLAPRS
jgi:hypothetical protein